jgi:hypothetical protein
MWELHAALSDSYRERLARSMFYRIDLARDGVSRTILRPEFVEFVRGVRAPATGLAEALILSL